MWLLRLLGVLTLIAVVGGIVAYFLTRNPVYLRVSWRVFRFSLIVALAVFGLMILERVAVIPI